MVEENTQVSRGKKGFIKSYTREIIAGVVFLAAYFPTLTWMWDRWFSADSYYSHGPLVPVFVIYLIWQNRKELVVLQRKESPWGFRLIIIGIVVHMLSSVLRIYFSSGFSMLVVLYGMVLYFWGSEIFKKISFPLAFLFFMVPLPLVMIAGISFKLKMLAAQIATFLLNSMRIPAVRDGSIIKMRHAYVVVDDVCSGLRSLIALTALGSVFSYWMKGGAVKRGLLFLSTIPIAIITNVCRIIFLSAISEIWGSEYATGLVHDVSGFMIFGLAFIMLYAVGKLLE